MEKYVPWAERVAAYPAAKRDLCRALGSAVYFDEDGSAMLAKRGYMQSLTEEEITAANNVLEVLNSSVRITPEGRVIVEGR